MANANSYHTYQTLQNAPDVSNAVANVSPTDTPLFSMAPTTIATARLKENVVESLADADEGNALAEGGTFTNDAIKTRTIESNWTQIFRKVIEVTATQEAVNHYGGIKSEMQHQVKNAFLELARDVEKAFIIGTSASGASATASSLSGVIEKVTTNTLTASSASALWTGTSSSNYNTYEDLLNDLFQTMDETGQRPDTVLVGGTQKRRISKLSTNITRNVDAEKKTQILAINVYDSDFGSMNIIYDRYVPATNILAIKKDMWRTAYLRRFKQETLAKVADSRQVAIVGQLTLDCLTEKAGGKITAS